MPAGRQFPVGAQINAHAEAASPRAARLVFLYLGGARVTDVPDVDPAVVSSPRQVPAVLAQRDGPDLPRLARLPDLRMLVPLSRLFRDGPDLDAAVEPGARGHLPVARCANVMAAELVGPADRLGDGEGRIVRVVDVDFRGATGGEDGSLGCCDGEDVGDVRYKGRSAMRDNGIPSWATEQDVCEL